MKREINIPNVTTGNVFIITDEDYCSICGKLMEVNVMYCNIYTNEKKVVFEFFVEVQCPDYKKNYFIKQHTRLIDSYKHEKSIINE